MLFTLSKACILARKHTDCFAVYTEIRCDPTSQNETVVRV